MEHRSPIATAPQPRRGRAVPTPANLFRCDAAGPRRGELEAFIAARFAQQYGARIRHFMPILLGMEDSAGRLQAAIGLRHASEGGLFLERYLDLPIEEAIAQQAGLAPCRAQIVEVGNLAASGAGSGSPLIAAMMISAAIDQLLAQGFDWGVFTGTGGLVGSLPRLGLAPLPLPLALGRADPARMGAEQAEWGSYYASQPRVMAGLLREGPWPLRVRALASPPDIKPSVAHA
jgi:hypothetical protein